MKYSEILREAKEIIYTKKESFVCHAIIAVKEVTKEQKLYLCGWIQKMLGSNIFYGEWLIKNHPEIHRHMSYENMREARIQWLDWMIADCEKEEAK